MLSFAQKAELNQHEAELTQLYEVELTLKVRFVRTVAPKTQRSKRTKTSTQKLPDFISRLKSIIYNYNPIVVSKLNTAGIVHLFIFNFCKL